MLREIRIVLALLLLMLNLFSVTATAYAENYPPFSSTEKNLSPLKVQPIIDSMTKEKAVQFGKNET